MASTGLMAVIRTPHGASFEKELDSLRVPTESGQVGLRPRTEPFLSALEPGLIIARTGDTYEYVGTAGGLLTCGGGQVTILTALAVVGSSAAAVLAGLETALAAPNPELEARRTIERLEQGILHEVREGRAAPLKVE